MSIPYVEREFTNIYLAAYCSSQKLHPKLFLKGTKVYFSFPLSKEFQDMENDYHQNCHVGVLDFSSAMRKLKKEILSVKDKGEKA